MSVQISNAFVTEYVADLIHTFQRRGGYLRPAVTMKENVVGSTANFYLIGKGTATTKARHGEITPMNQTHTAKVATLEDFYAGDYVDKLDESKITINERQALAEGGAWALGRKVDEQILASLDGTTQTVVNIDETSSATYLASALEWTEALFANDVANDGRNYAAITTRLHAQLSTIDEFTSSDYVSSNGTPFSAGMPVLDRWRDWMGVKWKAHTDTTTMAGGTANAKNFLWNASAVGYAAAASAGNIASNDMVMADITWQGTRAAHFINHMMSGGSVLIDDTGVIEASHNDGANIVTS